MYQKSFNYQFTSKYNELNFFVNNTNFYSFNALINKNVDCALFFGPTKSGKSFLGQLWLKKNNCIQYLNNFEQVINSNQNVLIDNFLSYNQEKIFYLINNCIMHKLKILIISDKKINEIKFKYKDLSSRLKTFNFLEIETPNDEMLLTILTKLLIDKQFIIKTNDIFDYILRRVDRSYEGIHKIVNKLDVLSLQKKRQLTIPLIKEIL